MPDSFLLPDEIKDLEQHMRHFPNQCFICKPSRGRGGEGISLIKKFHDLPRNANHNEYLVQRYVENPLLVQSKKFDIRLYIVIKGVDPIEAYLFEEGLARFCTVSRFVTNFEIFPEICIVSVWLFFHSKTTRNPIVWTCETCLCT